MRFYTDKEMMRVRMAMLDMAEAFDVGVDVLKRYPWSFFIAAIPSHPLLKHSACYIKIGRGKKKGVHVSDHICQDDCLQVSSGVYHSKAIEMIPHHIGVALNAPPKGSSRHVHRTRV